MEWIVEYVFSSFFNFIGASLRWMFFGVYSSIVKRPKTSFGEYLNGPKKPGEKYQNYDNEYDRSKNILVGGPVFFLSVFLIIKSIYF